jgi:hypothetical protein
MSITGSNHWKMKGPWFLLLLLVALPSRSARAQVDLVGQWRGLQYNDHMDIGDYTGIPLNEAGRLRAESYSPDQVDLPENLCRPIPSDMGYRVHSSEFYMWADMDKDTQKVLAYHTHLRWAEGEQTIWMDGRPHPPDYAPHIWEGFSTGKWEGDALVVTTDHLKEGYLTRAGVFRSAKAVETTRINRYGNILTMTFIINDPAYLSQPYIIESRWIYDPTQVLPPFPCEIATEGQVVPLGTVPSFLPGENPLLHDFAAEYGIPPEAALGGAETTRPEYVQKMQKMTKLPGKTTKHYARNG